MLYAPSSVVILIASQPYGGAAFGPKVYLSIDAEGGEQSRDAKKNAGREKWKVAGAGIFDFLDQKKLWFNHHLQSLRESLSLTPAHTHTHHVLI